MERKKVNIARKNWIVLNWYRNKENCKWILFYDSLNSIEIPLSIQWGHRFEVCRVESAFEIDVPFTREISLVRLRKWDQEGSAAIFYHHEENSFKSSWIEDKRELQRSDTTGVVVEYPWHPAPCSLKGYCLFDPVIYSICRVGTNYEINHSNC